MLLNRQKNLDVPNPSQEDYIATKVIKESSDIFSNFICLSFSNMIDVYIFLALLKLAIIKKTKLQAGKYLAKYLKSLQKVSFQANITFFGNIIRKFQCGFRQGLNVQYCLISMTEKCKKSVDKAKTFASLLTDLSKAFDCLPHC